MLPWHNQSFECIPSTLVGVSRHIGIFLRYIKHLPPSPLRLHASFYLWLCPFLFEPKVLSDKFGMNKPTHFFRTRLRTILALNKCEQHSRCNSTFRSKEQKIYYWNSTEYLFTRKLIVREKNTLHFWLLLHRRVKTYSRFSVNSVSYELLVSALFYFILFHFIHIIVHFFPWCWKMKWDYLKCTWQEESSPSLSRTNGRCNKQRRRSQLGWGRIDNSISSQAANGIYSQVLLEVWLWPKYNYSPPVCTHTAYEIF